MYDKVKHEKNCTCLMVANFKHSVGPDFLNDKIDQNQRYTYRVRQTIHMKLILLWVWAEQAVLGRAKTALKIQV